MHLLAATPGTISDGAEAVDPGQTPGDIIVLSAADSDLAVLSAAFAGLKSDLPGLRLRLFNLLLLGHPLSVDLYLDQVVRGAKLVVVRLIGGRGYWSYGVEQLSALCRAEGIALAFLPGDDQPDADLAVWSTLPTDALHRFWQYLLMGGTGNAEQFLRYAASLSGWPLDWRDPAPLPSAALYPPGSMLEDTLSALPAGQPVAMLVVYRALVQAGNIAALEALADALRAQGLAVLPLTVSSLKDPVSAALIETVISRCRPDVILNGTGFAVSAPGSLRGTPYDTADCPVLQVIFSGGNRETWLESTTGLSARDIAMTVALPEVDGRIITRAVSFKAADSFDPDTECPVVRYAPEPDRIAFVAELAARWVRLRRRPAAERRVAVVLANYPNRDGRLGNGVGLDTPAAVTLLLQTLRSEGYDTGGPVPDSPAALMQLVTQGPTNDRSACNKDGDTPPLLTRMGGKQGGELLPLPDYLDFLASLPDSLQQAITAHWGPPERDPFYEQGELSCGGFRLGIHRFGRIVLGVQPARGYAVDPVSSYHDPALVPPHGYLAFYAWLRQHFGCDALIHFGKHGNLEWLPGKSLALSSSCWPDAVFGPLPHLYPFIVNDPGEGTQAKRRTQAVIIDHLTPPLTRAGTYGPLRQLEQLVDEYYEATAVDPRRLKLLRQEILALSRSSGLDQDCGITGSEDDDDALRKLDNHLCELKELQIRDGLHIFGTAPAGDLLLDLLVALARAPRGMAAGQASLHRALAADLGLTDFDPLNCVMSAPWTGPRPAPLAELLPGEPWRIAGDTVERIEELARTLIAAGIGKGEGGDSNNNNTTKISGATAPGTPSGERPPSSPGAPIPHPIPHGSAAAPVLDWVFHQLRPTVEACGQAELRGLLHGLAGGFVPPGPSGAPTRGRPDVLPTGRNFFSVDSRTVPTPAAWTLGWKAAGALIDRHMQEHGGWPKAVAITAWGTSNMRTGGDDIAQALALLGVRPTWDQASRRVTGFEILPLTVLDRPRIDVTLRVSGFFRDAFPALIDLFDSAVRAVAALDEAPADNPLAAAVRNEAARLQAAGKDPADASRKAAFRVFGSRPGAYGAGLQTLIDERCWSEQADLARAYIAWGGYAYGAGAGGTAEHGLFETRLSKAEMVIQAQDNQEHDLLDSDDYYQFEGGMAAAVKLLSGQAPKVYHIDTALSDSPRVRTLEEEIARIVRGRVVNPKWIAGAMRHGYKGAFEMAATVDYLFAFAATTGSVTGHHFDAVFAAYLEEETVRDFLREANPAALADIVARLREALQRGLWQPRRNAVHYLLEDLLA